MAATSRTATASLEQRLLQTGHDFPFFQAMRLLLMLAAETGKEGEPARVRVRPELSLAFPAADVAGIDRTPYGYLLRVTFLGLYGQSSPLPSFYTEKLMEDAAVESTAARDLLDALNHRLLTLFFHSVAKYWLIFQVAQEREEYLELLFCLIGRGGRSFRPEVGEPRALLRHAGLLGQRSRSAAGLRLFLSEALGIPVQVMQCRERKVPVPEDQRLRLGSSCCRIGEDAVLGSEARDRSGMFRVRLGPLDGESYRAYLPGAVGRDRLDALVRSYLPYSLLWEVELVLTAGQAPAVCLGNLAGGRLGWDSWLKTGSPAQNSALFPAAVFPD